MFEGEYGKQFGTMVFTKFAGDPQAANDQFGEGMFLHWARHNKRSWSMIRFACGRCFELSPARR